MRNVLMVQLETKIALAVVLIIVAIFIFTIIKNVDNFNKVIKNAEPKTEYQQVEP